MIFFFFFEEVFEMNYENDIINNVNNRVCLDRTYFAETENLLLKSL